MTQKTPVWPPTDRRTELEKREDEYKYFASQAQVSALAAFRCILPISRRDQFDNGTPWSNHSKALMCKLDEECREGVMESIVGLGQYKESLERHNAVLGRAKLPLIDIERDPVRVWQDSWANRFSALAAEHISIVPDEWHHLQNAALVHNYSRHAYAHGIESTLGLMKAHSPTPRQVALIEELNYYLMDQAEISARTVLRCIVHESSRDSVDRIQRWDYPNAEYNTDILMHDRDRVARVNARQCIDELSDLGQDRVISERLWRECWEKGLSQAVVKHANAIPISQQMRQRRVITSEPRISNIAWDDGAEKAVRALNQRITALAAYYIPLIPTQVAKKSSEHGTPAPARQAIGNVRRSSRTMW
ncbi:hypothetical protein ACH4C6_34205 [Streptomyces sp. NPDC017943]|uniref:hypothetical protein n=1 Tax=Streptomyces sp. NPDC017943 TaxID=3365019 RepID=UPI0037BCBB3D